MNGNIDKHNLVPLKQANVTVNGNSEGRTKKGSILRHRFNLKQTCYRVRSVNATSDNRYLIITFENNTKIRVIDLEKLEYLPYKFKGHTDSVRLTSITKDNKAFYTASWDCTSRLFELGSGKCTRIFGGFGRSPSCFLDDQGKYLFTASYDSDLSPEKNNTGRCWDISTGKMINLYKHTYNRTTPDCMDIAYDQEFVYTGSDDGCAYRWDLKRKKPNLIFFELKGSVRKIAVSDNFFAAACTDGFVRVHYKHSGKCFRYLSHGKKDVRDVRISKNEKLLWSASEDGSVKCFNLITGRVIYTKDIHINWIWSICLMSDDKVLVTSSGDGTIAFLSSDSGKVLARLWNLPTDNEFLIACPSDKVFPTGFYYTTNKEFIQVVIENKNKTSQEILDSNDPRRATYINGLNNKNLVITKLKNNGHYASLIDHYIQNHYISNQASGQNKHRLLKS
jgi:WD40 repeat protein